jgi:hypothetical protein
MPLRRYLTLALLTFSFAPLRAHADIGVMVANPTNLGASRYTSAGHALLFLSGVCPVTPIHARLCNPGEQGSVLTVYPNFRESNPYNWNLVPLSVYLDGSLTPGNRLLYGSTYIKQALELHARITLLQSLCTNDTDCPQLPHSSWRDIVAATVDRDIFLYAVHTTSAQDQTAVDWLNQNPNQNHYNGFTNNCADFVASLINLLFPHSVHRDLLNDVGMMSPKSAAKSFTHWALQRPELGFYSLHFAQIPSDIPRAGLARSGTETVIHTKKYLIPAIVLGDWELPTSIVSSYVLTGRFSLYHQYADHPPPDTQPNPGSVGTPEDWAPYRQRLTAIENEAQPSSLDNRKHLFPRPYATATASVDSDGLPWLTPDPANPSRRVGLGSANLLAPNSDPQFAFELILARVRYALTAKDRHRETLQEFQQDWSLLEQAQSRLHSIDHAKSSTSFAVSAGPSSLPLETH